MHAALASGDCFSGFFVVKEVMHRFYTCDMKGLTNLTFNPSQFTPRFPWQLTIPWQELLTMMVEVVQAIPTIKWTAQHNSLICRN